MFYFKCKYLQLLLGYTSFCLSKTDTCDTQQGFCKIIQKYVTFNLLIMAIYLTIMVLQYSCLSILTKYHIFFQQYKIFKGLIYRMSEFQSLMHCLVVMKMIARIFSICLRCCTHFNGNTSLDSPILLIARTFSHCCYVLLRV